MQTVQTAEEHLTCLCIIFDQFREHNLKLKLSKCEAFRNKITYLACQVLKDGVCPSNFNLEAMAECAPLCSYTEVCTFLSLLGHYQGFIKGFACNAQSLSEYFAGEGASKKLEWVSLKEEAMKAFKTLKQVCMTTPILVFADYTKPFLLKTNPIQRWIVGGVVTAERQMGDTTPLPLAAGL